MDGQKDPLLAEHTFRSASADPLSLMIVHFSRKIIRDLLLYTMKELLPFKKLEKECSVLTVELGIHSTGTQNRLQQHEKNLSSC